MRFLFAFLVLATTLSAQGNKQPVPEWVTTPIPHWSCPARYHLSRDLQCQLVNRAPETFGLFYDPTTEEQIGWVFEREIPKSGRLLIVWPAAFKKAPGCFIGQAPIRFVEHSRVLLAIEGRAGDVLTLECHGIIERVKETQ